MTSKVVDEPTEAEFPSFREVLRDELGIVVPLTEKEGIEFWKGLSPHLVTFVRIWAIYRVGVRWPDWIGGFSAEISRFAAGLPSPNLAAAALGSALGPPLLGSALLSGIQDVAHTIADALESEDPAAALEDAKAGAHGFAKKHLEALGKRTRRLHRRLKGDPSGGPSRAEFAAEAIQVQVDVLAGAIIAELLIEQLPFSG